MACPQVPQDAPGALPKMFCPQEPRCPVLFGTQQDEVAFAEGSGLLEVAASVSLCIS